MNAPIELRSKNRLSMMGILVKSKSMCIGINIRSKKDQDGMFSMETFYLLYSWGGFQRYRCG